MKKNGMIILSTLLLSSVILLFSGCKEDVLQPEGVNTSAPVIKGISSSAATVLIGGSTEVSVESDDASSYLWTADMGTFSDPTAATTTYTAPELDSNAVVRLKCTVTNSSGNRFASVQVKIATSLAPEGVAAWWPFEADFTEQVGGIEADVIGDVTISSDARVGDGAALFGGTFEDVSMLLYDGANVLMGPDDDFTISVWMNSEDPESGWIFGLTDAGEYYQGGKGLYYEWEGPLVFDISWIDGIWAEDGVTSTDGSWHHVAAVKEGMSLTIYFDGEEVAFGEPDDWSSDEGMISTIGAAFEEAGGDWPGNFQGLMDDLRFYQSALSPDEIAAIVNE